MIRLTAHAKINWFLDITGKRSDGYHLLDTVFQTISLGDELSFRAAADLRLTCSEPGLPLDERNLAMKAAIRLRALLQEKRGAAIHLKKICPMGAGLGGGSADAAAVLKGLLKFWRRRVDASALRRLAVGLGADVPFFLIGGTCAAKGIGEKLRVLKPAPKTWLVIVWPGFGVATKEAYAKVQLPFADGPRSFSLRRGKPPHYGRPRLVCGGIGMRVRPHLTPLLPQGEGMFNRFESLVFPDHPVLPQLKEELISGGAAAALMSGSGSAVFGVMSSQGDAKKLHAQLKARYPHTWIAHTL